MSANFIKKEGYTVEFDLTVSAEKFEEGMQKSYIKNVKSINIPGFRKGKAPRKYIEKLYSEAIFYDDAINFVFPSEYEAAIKELDIEPVDRPDVDVKQVGEGKDLILNVKVDVIPEVKLGEYKGLAITEKKYAVAEKDVKAELERMRERNSRMITVEDRAIKKDDTANIDFEGFVDGVAFAGGKGENHDLVIGSGSFIPGFEDQLIGAKTGDEVEVNVKFPEEYHAEELKGKDAMFKVKVNKISYKELPELDDEFAKDASEFDTLKDLKADIKAKMKAANERRAKQEMEAEAIEKLIGVMTADIPEGMIESRTESLLRDFEMRLYQQGMDIQTYQKYTGMSMDDFKKQFRPQAENAVKSTLALDEVAKLEKFKVTEKELEAKIAEMAKNYGMEIEKINEVLRDEDKENIKKDCLIEKAVDFIVKNATLVAEEEKPAAKKTTTKATTEKKTTKTATEKKTTTKTTTAKKTTAKATTEKKTTKKAEEK